MSSLSRSLLRNLALARMIRRKIVPEENRPLKYFYSGNRTGTYRRLRVTQTCLHRENTSTDSTYETFRTERFQGLGCGFFLPI